MKVSALLVSHNGARWLPQVMTALAASTSHPETIVAVDTGSQDDSVALVRAGLGVDVLGADPTTSYAAAVRTGLAALPPADPTEDEWVWLLHDDGAPGPHCLERLRHTAESVDPSVAVIGPKLREWPSLKRLLEVGVTISGTGRRETGLEPGEYDQGQHDDNGPVLAVNTAGMLIRRSVLAEFGLAEELPIFGNDLDLGWRLARRGHEVVVDPAAVMFHVEAAHRGRRTSAVAGRPRRDERAAAIFVLLANGSRRAQPIRVLRLLVGGLLRALGFLLVRAPGDARDELAAMAVVYRRPGALIAARRQRNRAATVPHRDVDALLAPVWMPWRHGLDFVVDLARALGHLAGDSVARRRAGAPPLPLGVRLLHSPSAWAGIIAVVVALVASRSLLHGASLHGGALLPAPGGVGHWWALWGQSWHWVGPGSASPAPAYLLPLSLVATVLFGQPGLVVWLLFVLTVPLAMFGALRFLRRITTGGWAPVWGAATYALLPVVSGSVSQGRLGTVAAMAILPWAAASALGLAADDPDRRRRALWRTALAAGLLIMFVPSAILILWVLLALAPWLGAGKLTLRELLCVALTPVLFLLPWLPALVHAPGALLVEAGRAATLAVHPGLGALLTGSSAGPGAAPTWLFLGVPLAAVVALVRADTRSRVTRLWLVALVAAVILAVLARLTISLPGVPVPFRVWSGFTALVVQGALVVAIVLAGDRVGAVVERASFGWRQPVAAVAFVAAVLAPLAGAVWWLGHGTEGPVGRSDVARVPAYLSELGQARHNSATLLLRGGPGVIQHPVVTYRVVRNGADLIGDDGVLAMTSPSTSLTDAVAGLVGASSPGDVNVLASHGIAYVFAAAPVSSAVAGALDASSGFASASAPNHHTRAWRVVPNSNLSAVDSSGNRWHALLDILQILALVAVVVLALPTRREAA